MAWLEKRHGTWRVCYRVGGKIKRTKGFRDKLATRQLAAKLEVALARGETGLVDPFRDHKIAPLLSHIDAYAADLRAKGRAEMYVYTADRRLRLMAEACGWSTLSEIDANSFVKWRERLRTKPQTGAGRTGRATSARTVNQYLETGRSFLAWCRAVGRFGNDPLAEVAKVSGDPVRKRRALTDEEAAKLLEVTPNNRRLFYRLAMAVGLRRGEMIALKWGDVRSHALPQPYLQLRAEATKARRADRLALPPTLANDLRAARPADANDAAAVFPAPPTIDDWKTDLAAAGIPWLDAMGRQVDFHAGTRKTLCTRMHRAGVPLAVAMRIMRHTDARLTMVDYADEVQLGIDETLAGLPEPVQPTRAHPVATGTDGNASAK